MFSERINCIEKLIKINGIVVDVGSDHAQLAIRLLTRQKAKHVYNVEVNKGPYLNTVNSLKKVKLLDQTTNIFANGLKTLMVDKPIDYCVIAGLGANTIIDILQNKNKRLIIKNYILVPNNKTPILREWLKKQKFKINYEEIIFENDYYYQVLVINETKGLIIKDKFDIYFGPYLLKHRNQKFKVLHQATMNKIKENNLNNINANKHHELQLLERVLKHENYRN